MAIFRQGNDRCYFIHIPRTGGRYVTSLFENSNNVECKYHRINEIKLEGVDCTHLHYPLYCRYFDVENIPHISVVRNPFDKFHSCIKIIKSRPGNDFIDYNQILTNENEFLNFMDYEINEGSYHNNWFLPQHKFISPQTHIWKYENGFGEEFRKWVLEKTNIDISLGHGKYKMFDNEPSKDYQYNLNNKIKSYIEKFYIEDYKIFGY